MRSSIRLSLLLPTLAAVLFSNPAAADELLIPLRSVRVRLAVSTVDSGPLVGRVLEARDDTLTLLQGKDALDVPCREVERLEVRNGFHRATARGALVGLVVGTGAGAALGAGSDNGDFQDLAILLGAVLGGLNGAAGGALVGSGFVRERWEEVPRSGIRVGPGRDVWIPVPANQPVRVTARPGGPGRRVGTSAALAGDSLTLRRRGHEERIPFKQITRIETTWARKSRGPYGAVIGFAAGFASGVMLHGDLREGSDAGTGALVGLAGALVGALVGAQFEVARWEEIPLRPPPLRPLDPGIPSGR